MGKIRVIFQDYSNTSYQIFLSDKRFRYGYILVRNKLREEKCSYKPVLSMQSNNYFRLGFNKLRLGAIGQQPDLSYSVWNT